MARHWRAWGAPFVVNLLLGVPAVVPIWLVWYLLANGPLAEFGGPMRNPTENDGLLPMLVVIGPVVVLFGLIWWLANQPLRRRTALAPRSFWLLCVLVPFLPTAVLIANSP
ncbi:hypothetical protein ACI3K5_05340 [Streptomyces sp. MPA0124]|uniref:hypothetical protein n=1 Tax=unclassified Streptomyces TaxID=2593676 RepID=UPI0007769884|nr:hypothetical protein [Streptomyces sp. CCM_MD2014]MDA4890823.1 hypothetical protein [Streptomyces sp. MS2A]MYS55407.1 hypothetical protein [Streptomyces sp. SID6013]